MARYTGRNRLILLAGTAAVIGTGVWVAMGNLVNTNTVRGELQRAVHNAIGRDLTILGGIRIIPGLNPALVVNGIALSNTPGGSPQNILSAQSLRASLELLPLLTGAVVVHEVVLEQPELLLQRAPDGTPDWRFSRPARPITTRTPESAGGPPAGGGHNNTSLDIRRVLLQGGHITWQGADGAPAVLAIDRAEITTDGVTSPLFAGLRGHLGDLPVTFDAQAGDFERLEGGPVTALAGSWPLSGKLSVGDASASWNGGVNHPEDFRGYSFQFTANAPDLQKFYVLLPPALALPLHDVNLTVRLSDGSNDQFRTNALSIFAGASDLSAAIPGLILKKAVFSAPGPGQQVQLSVDGTFQGAPLRVNGTSTQPDVLEAGIPVPLAFSAQAASASITARGTIPPSWGGTGLELDVSVRAPSLADLSPFALRKLPDVQSISFDGKLSDAGFRLRGVAVHDMVFTSSLGDLAGNVTAAWSPVPTLNGTLKAKSFDLDAARAAWVQISTPVPASVPPASAVVPPATAPGVVPSGNPPAAAGLFSDVPIDFSTLHAADADLTLSAAELKVDGQSWHEFDAHLFANDGKLILNPLRVRTPDGVLIGALSIDAAANPPPLAITLRSPSLSAGGLASFLGAPGAASGNVQVDMELNATGGSRHAMAATLGGHLGLSMVDGQITDALWQNALGDTLGQAGIPVTGGATGVRCFALRLNFAHGQGHVDALALDTSRLELEGEGGINLADETLSLHLRPTLAVGGAGVAAPVSLTGAFTAPKAALDPVLGGRFGLSIGGAGPDDSKCIAALPVARGGTPGPLPTAVAVASGPDGKKKKKPKDLLQGLFH